MTTPDTKSDHSQENNASQLWQDNAHYFIKIIVSGFLCTLLLIIGVPVFMISRMTGSLSYTLLGVVFICFGLILAVAVLILAFNPPWKKK